MSKVSISGLPIFHRLLLVFFIVISVVSFGYAFSYFIFSSRNIEHYAEELIAVEIAEIEQSFNSTVRDTLIRDLLVLSSSSVLDNFLMATGVRAEINVRSVERLFLQSIRYSKDVEEISFYNYLGAEQVRANRTGRSKEYRNLSGSDFFSQIKSSEPGTITIETPHTGADGLTRFFIAISKNDPDIGEFGGAVVIDYSLSEFFSTLKTKTTFNENHVWVFDTGGNLLLQPEPASPFLDPRSGFTMPRLDNPPYVTLDGGFAVAVGLEIIPGKPLLQAYISLPSSLLQKDIFRVLRFLLIVLAVSVPGIIVVIYFVSKYLARPIVDLASNVSGLALKSFSEPIQINAGGEVGLLVENFNEMISTLRTTTVSRDYMDSIVNTMVNSLLVLTPQGEIQTVNAATSLLLGYKKEDLLGRPVSMALGKEVMEFILENETIHGKEISFYPQKGGEVPVLFSCNRMYDFSGEVEALVCLARDITELKESALELAAEKERLAVTLRSIGDGVITTDISGNIVLLNKVAENLTGWGSQEAAGRPLEEVFHIINEQTREVCENPVTKVVSSGQIFGLANHTALITKEGIERSINDSGAPILDAESNIIGVVLVFRDVTEQIKTEKELLKVKKLESIGVLAGGIAHDFNNILAAILGNINLAVLDINLKPETKKLLDAAEKASLRAKDLTQQLLTFSKGGEPIKQAASIREVIKDSADFVLHGGNVDCRYHIPDDIWFVEIDKGQISQVIQNIIINAKHAMPDGGTIQVTGKNIDPLHLQDINHLPRDTNFVEVTITDSGIGMPVDIIDKIFDPYFSTKQEGSGLGLAVSHSIITKHNGHITVKSTPGVGTSFSIYLPVSRFQQEKEKEEEIMEVAKGKAKIMVMDDDEMIRDVAQSMLSLMGHEVLLAQDGVEALALYKEHSDSGEPIAIVIMDLTIPGGMGGQDAVKEVLAFDPDAKVIVCSGYSNDPIMANCQQYGFCAAIVKPYQLQELTKVINQVMASKHQ